MPAGRDSERVWHERSPDGQAYMRLGFRGGAIATCSLVCHGGDGSVKAYERKNLVELVGRISTAMQGT
jgi:hypothetical protein